MIANLPSKYKLDPGTRRASRQNRIGVIRPRRPLSHKEWAEKYVVLGAGPYKDRPFRVNRQPIIGLLFSEFDRGFWNEIYISGPSQSSKSLCAFVIPTLRDVHELRLDALVGTPEADMMSDKWDKDFMPVLGSSPALRHLIPTKGPGSKSGRVKDRITLGNKIDIKVMTRGGRDTNKAGYSSPRLRLTEAAGWSKASEVSVEGGPFRQLLARMRAFTRNDPRRLLTVEGTMTVPEELPWSARGEDDDEIFRSTRSSIQSPCPHCESFISPVRKHLIGWANCESEMQVEEQATWSCPVCKSPISESERKASLADCRLVHSGQWVDNSGTVCGEIPPTRTLWFAWESWHNLLLTAADVALDEWEADQHQDGTKEKDDAERALCQFVHGIPFESALAENAPLRPTVLRKRVDIWKRNVIPHDTVALTIGVDIGKWTSWWVCIAHREGGQKHIAAYGAFDVMRSKDDDLESRIVASLHDFADTIVEEGFPQEGKDGFYIPDRVLIDGGYMPDCIAKFVRERGGIRQNRYFLTRGRGQSHGTESRGYNQPGRKTTLRPRNGKQWFGQINHERRIVEITMNADHWKLDLDARLRPKVGSKGSLSFYAAELKNEHAKITTHFCNEQFKRDWEPGKGLVDTWVLKGDNHYKDSAAMALCGGDMCGVRVEDLPEEKTEADAPGAELPKTDFWHKLTGGVQLARLS